MLCYAVVLYCAALSSAVLSYAEVYFIILAPPKLSYCTIIIYYTMLYYTILCHAILYYTILRNTLLYCTILCYAILYYTILCYTIPYHTMLRNTTLYNTIPYYTVLHYSTQYCNKLNWSKRGRNFCIMQHNFLFCRRIIRYGLRTFYTIIYDSTKFVTNQST